MKVKKDASIANCRAPILRALIWIEPLFVSRNVELVVTSGTGEKHSAERSGHYRGDGVDIRSRTVPADQRQTLAKAIRRKLGSAYVVILESNHYHIHWSPTLGTMV
jgi:hypothetical protein|tara:strand:- start:5139 stop:5456 length:318 start_codon:yes stop_codon:yes gene_type:complete